MKNKQLIHYLRLVASTVFIAAFIAAFPNKSCAMGERYTAEGGALSKAITDTLMSKGFCKTAQECQVLLPSYGGHGDQVRIAFYEIGPRNIHAFDVVTSLVIKDGCQITSGIPIIITGYKETHEKYRQSGLFFKSAKPFVTLEVAK